MEKNVYQRYLIFANEFAIDNIKMLMGYIVSVNCITIEHIEIIKLIKFNDVWHNRVVIDEITAQPDFQ